MKSLVFMVESGEGTDVLILLNTNMNIVERALDVLSEKYYGFYYAEKKKLGSLIEVVFLDMPRDLAEKIIGFFLEYLSLLSR